MFKRKSSIILISIVIMLNIFSLLTIYGLLPKIAISNPHIENTEIFLIKQSIAILVGYFAIFLIYIVDLDKIRPLINICFYILLGMLLILALYPPILGDIFVVNVNGMNGWFRLPFGITIQPAEFMKFVLIFKLAEISYSSYENNWSDKKLSLHYLLYGGGTVALVLLLPDLGMALMLFAPVYVMYLVSIKNKRFIKMIILGTIILLLLGVIFLIFPKGQEFLVNYTPIHWYQIERINAWLSPFEYDSGYQLQQSLILIGSAGPFGMGLGETTHIHFPESHTDFIFSEFVGMFGWILGLFVIIMYMVLINELISIGKKSKEVYYKYLMIGITSLYVIQITESLGMVIGVLPVTGVVLPYMSYGMSAMLTFLCLLGVIINIDRRNQF